MRQKVVLLITIILILISVYYLKSRSLHSTRRTTDTYLSEIEKSILLSSEKLQIYSEFPNISVDFLDKNELIDFLEKYNFWNSESFNFSGKVVKGKPDKLVIILTDQIQSYNKETRKRDQKIIGSVSVVNNKGAIVLYIQSDKQIWAETDPSWHVESQLIRFVVGNSNHLLSKDMSVLLKDYRSKKLFFNIHED